MLSVTKKIALSMVLACITALIVCIPVKADGGLLVPYDLWAQLKEGQQIAVVTLRNDGNAKMDLFISILDKTQQSHDITFFLPLGASTSNFYAVEQNISDFDNDNTRGLDEILRDGATARQRAVQALFSGTLLSNGGILVPLWTPMLLSGCAAAEPKPEASYQTESSQISIYDISEDTDLQALISTTGLHSSVQDTLSRLVGQQIAVVKMQTHPQTSSGDSSYRNQSEPGLHLSWYSSFVATESGPAYTYPLGTGGAWSKPIDLTRVYVVAPTNADFKVRYPALGSQQSGYDIIEGARIANYYQVPSYAVDEARGSFGRVWRVTYTQSNPTDDIVITIKPESVWSRLQNSIAESALPIAFLFALIVGLVLWFLSWHYLMPRFLGKYNNGRRLQWYFALIYPAINATLIIFPGSILYVFFLIGLTVPSLAVLFLILAGVSIGVFELIHGGRLGVSRGVATRAFVFVSLASSGAYLILSFAFAKLIGIL
ncbi:MAG: hypothetical protein MUO99_04970 [Dehalococcoidales bacterium]|nr:hypothetical protein [Dehalococcoidales bacterium]